MTTGRSKPGKSRGAKILLSFVVLSLICVSVIWYSGYFDSSHEGEVSSGTVSTRDANEATIGSRNVVEPQHSTVKTDPKTAPIVPVAEEKESKPSIPDEKANLLKRKLAEAERLFKNEEFVNAAAVASSIIESGIDENTDLWRRAAKILGDSDIKVFMSDIPSPRKKLYTIQSGDNLISIANKFGTTVEAVQKSNGLSENASVIYPGKTLYIYSGNWNVKVSRSRFKLYLYDDGKLFKVYTVGVGRQGRTPLGTFIIQNKRKHPVWYYNGRTIPYGDKENVLGTRWMALKPTGDTNKNLSGYGIHGTWKPETVGTQCSNGCVRMRNEEVNELFTILPYHTKVTIEE